MLKITPLQLHKTLQYDWSIELKEEFFKDYFNAITSKINQCLDLNNLCPPLENIFNAYIDGRTEIHNQGSLNEIITHRNIIITELERVVASSIVHYLNKVTLDMDTLIISDSTQSLFETLSLKHETGLTLTLTLP